MVAELLTTGGMWHIAYGARHVLCPDGKRRYARIIGQPDTFFSQPASVCYRGKTVHGYITGIETDGKRDLEFRVVMGYRNSAAFTDCQSIA